MVVRQNFKRANFYDLFRRLVRLAISLATFVLLTTVFVLPICATWAGDLETKVKAAYIYNFIKFVEWPNSGAESEKGPIRICVIGNDPIRTVLGELSNRVVNGRQIRIVHIRELNDLPPCEILFISRSESSQVPMILQHFQGMPVLTVSDISQFAARGGMINFITEKGRVRIEINQRTVRQASLKISAKLLEVARVVQ